MSSRRVIIASRTGGAGKSRRLISSAARAALQRRRRLAGSRPRVPPTISRPPSPGGHRQRTAFSPANPVDHRDPGRNARLERHEPRGRSRHQVTVHKPDAPSTTPSPTCPSPCAAWTDFMPLPVPQRASTRSRGRLPCFHRRDREYGTPRHPAPRSERTRPPPRKRSDDRAPRRMHSRPAPACPPRHPCPRRQRRRARHPHCPTWKASRFRTSPRHTRKNDPSPPDKAPSPTRNAVVVGSALPTTFA